MGRALRVACVQTNAGSDVRKNLKEADALILEAHRRGAELICLPEGFNFRGSSRKYARVAESLSGSLIRYFQNRAKKLKVYLLLGSILERSALSNKFYNTSVLLGPNGRMLARYRKRYLFESRSRKLRCNESDHVLAGKKDALAQVKGIRVGIGICYDLRFPEFIGRLVKKGAEIVLFPSNFAEQTGKVHWELLCRARAVENLCFIVAPNQGGENPHTHLRAFGRSIIVGPWGQVVGKVRGRGKGLIVSTLALDNLRKLRRTFPALSKRF